MENINPILKTEGSLGAEHHWLPTCPCETCVARRGCVDFFTEDTKRSITVEAAYLLGYIASRSPHGSVARELQIAQGGL